MNNNNSNNNSNYRQRPPDGATWRSGGSNDGSHHHHHHHHHHGGGRRRRPHHRNRHGNDNNKRLRQQQWNPPPPPPARHDNHHLHHHQDAAQRLPRQNEVLVKHEPQESADSSRETTMPTVPMEQADAPAVKMEADVTAVKMEVEDTTTTSTTPQQETTTLLVAPGESTSETNNNLPKVLPAARRLQQMQRNVPTEADEYAKLCLFDTSADTWVERDAVARARQVTETWLRNTIPTRALLQSQGRVEQEDEGYFDSDSDDDEDDEDEDDEKPRMVSNKQQQQGDLKEKVLAPYLQLLHALPSFQAMTATFFTLPLEPDHDKWNYCPCCYKVRNWRNQNVWKRGELLESQKESSPYGFQHCEQQRMGPNGLLQHLKSTFTPHKEKNLPVDYFHGVVLKYLQTLLEDYFGPNIAHYACYDRNSKAYNRARAKQNGFFVQLQKERDFWQARAAAQVHRIQQIEQVNEEYAQKLRQGMQEIKELKDYLPFKGKGEKDDRQLDADELECMNENRHRFFKIMKRWLPEPVSEYMDIHVAQTFDSQKPLTEHFIDNLTEETAAKWLAPWEITFEMHDEVKLDKKLKQNRQAIIEMIAKDSGGPTRAFLSEFWRQIPKLTVTRTDENEKTWTAPLWYQDERTGCLFPHEDATIMAKLGLAGTEDSLLYTHHYKQAKKICRPIARAVGRLIFYCMANTLEDAGKRQYFHVDERVLPDIYIYLIFKNLKKKPNLNMVPFDELLSFLWDHKLSPKGTTLGQSDIRNVTERLNDYIREILPDKLDGMIHQEQLKQQVVQECMEQDFVVGRQLVLSAFEEGITFLDENLKDSIHPTTLLWSEYKVSQIKQCFFSRASCHVEDVIECLTVDESTYCTEITNLDGVKMPLGDDAVQYQRDVLSMDKDGRVVGLLPDVLREMCGSGEHNTLASDFLEFATGVRGVPYDTSEFFVKIEFSSDGAASAFDALPRSHTCSKEVVFPYTAYFGEKQMLKEKIEQSLKYCRGFDCDAYGSELVDAGHSSDP